MATKQKYSADDGRTFFRRLAKEGPWAPIYLLMGSERYLLTEAIERLTRSIFPDGPDDFNYSIFDAKEHSSSDVIAACEMLPMFAEKRLVRLRNVDAWKVNDLNQLAYYVDKPSDTTLLIMDAASFSRQSSAGKRIYESPSVAKMGFEGLNANDTAQWVVRRAKTTYRLLIRRDIAAHIVDHVGESLDVLDRTLERLMLFIGAPKDADEPVVTLEQVDEVIVDTRMRSVFELTDALANKDLQRAVLSYRRMRLHGDSPIGAVSMIAREFRGLIASHEGRREGIDDRRLATLIGGPPWALKKYHERAHRFQRAELHRIHNAIAQTATELTSSRLADDLHVERLFLEICRPTRRNRRA